MKRLLVCLVLLAGCATPPKPPAQPSPHDEAWYASAKDVYTINRGQTLITIVVHKGGALARLGHDHVVASHTVTGFASPAAGRADFHFRLDELTVDEPGLRKAAGFDVQPSPEAVAGTRTNMLTRVLDAEHFPDVLLHAEKSGDAMRLSITLHGVTRTMDVPTVLKVEGDALTASGKLALRQSDFGVVPLSVLGGAIAVLDQLDLAFTISARRSGAGPGPQK
ncbi:MAG: YceI family protein [Pseudomonadota bacterium]